MTVNLMDVVDRMQHEIQTLGFIQDNTKDRQLEGWLSVMVERMEITQNMLHDIIKIGHAIESGQLV